LEEGDWEMENEGKGLEDGWRKIGGRLKEGDRLKGWRKVNGVAVLGIGGRRLGDCGIGD
jgi:hypothetical protein